MNRINQPLFFTFPAPENDPSELCGEIERLVEFEPELLKRIEEDLSLHGKEKKRIRLMNKRWAERNLSPLPGIEIDEREPVRAEVLTLGAGRPRMGAYVALLFTALRGFLSGIKESKVDLFLRESMTIHLFLEKRGLKTPGLSTIVENLNAIRSETKNAILDAQVRMALNEKLDDFRKLTIDGTAVKANSAWPNDSAFLSRLAERLWKRGGKLERFGLKNMKPRKFESTLETMNSLSVEIAPLSGKTTKEGKNRIKKLYRELLKAAKKIEGGFDKETERISKDVLEIELPPGKHLRLLHLAHWMNQDLAAMKKIAAYCKARIRTGKAKKSNEKILGLSDKDAAYIQKGGREAVIGYKPQLGRSERGFLTAISVPTGNASDAGALVSTVKQHRKRSRVVPRLVVADGGYASKKNKEALEKNRITKAVFSGSKGKKITSTEDWESEKYRAACRERSAIESLNYTIKRSFGFGRVMRRGIDAVTEELLEKAIAYNAFRMLSLRKRRAKEKSISTAA